MCRPRVIQYPIREKAGWTGNESSELAVRGREPGGRLGSALDSPPDSLVSVRVARSPGGHHDVNQSSCTRGAARTWLDVSRPAPQPHGSVTCRFSSELSTMACMP